MMNFNNVNIRKYDNKNERNGAGFGANSDTAAFESWACESFNLFEFLGEDTSPLDEVVPEKMDEDEIEKQKEDAMYSQFQYSDMLIGGQHPTNSHHDFGVNDFANVPSDGCSDFDVPTAFHEGVPFPMPPATHQIYSHNMDAIPHVPSTSKSSMPLVKQEPISEQEQINLQLGLDAPKSSRESSVTSGSIHFNSLRPRRYRIKPDSEKQNPLYRIKRQKNNDAVRRSRDKAKRIQEAKESELKLLQDDNCRKAELIETLKASNAQLQGENLLLRQNCRCGAVLRVAKR
ncbi:hypothetical protein niasHS_002584 [Heterodera schachtii]|uniref:BZIP domain-containing protein n=1 Tax=Heterodera schachtii TaxID=97005 RepID=A0ABD2KKE5_HETSC